ncbi:hypothetical protein HAPAU_35660 [Halalkalicoccus paucihalophilus]|uniref:Uncharacterized protein n=1 Tax=Halalkalicoccus paucihalophilus TaxID=1008153 RepID=A0A151AAF0_9EURY|nr:hypothetical protein HAPAU_35660 [Halalkalicoccus paucihalophilus]
MEFIRRMLPKDNSIARAYNLALVDFGTLICDKSEYNCETCFASNYCFYHEKGVNT